jgi:hypothetical protein
MASRVFVSGWADDKNNQEQNAAKNFALLSYEDGIPNVFFWGDLSHF